MATEFTIGFFVDGGRGNWRNVRRRLQRQFSNDVVLPAAGVFLRNETRTIVNQVKSRHGGAWPGGTTATTLSRRSGRGTGGIRTRVRRQGNAVTASIFVPDTLAFHEEGGIINVRRRKYMTVPLRAALTSRGTKKKQRATDWKDSFVVRTKSGKKLIAQKATRAKGDKRIRPLYVLKKSVRIPPRLGLNKMINDRSKTYSRDLLRKITEAGGTVGIGR